MRFRHVPTRLTVTSVSYTNLPIWISLLYSQPVFTLTEQPLPATLLRLLLLTAGNEANPGPLWCCSLCQVRLGCSDCFVRCGSCNGWYHLRCSGLTNSADWSPTFSCPSCPMLLSAPTPPVLPSFHTNAEVSDLTIPPDLKLLQFNANVSSLERKGDDIRVRDFNDPRIGYLNGLIIKIVNDGIHKRWHELVADYNFRRNLSATWKLLRNLTKPRVDTFNQSISFGNGNFISNDSKIATKMNKLFSPRSVSSPKSQLSLLGLLNKAPAPGISFSADAIRAAVKKTKASKALGPDGLAPPQASSFDGPARNPAILIPTVATFLNPAAAFARLLELSLHVSHIYLLMARQK
ncbi:unnamed protein product [Dibothriocephalus latus]|uniref:Zinc finger PHD-type domain-containing protein n=1 Tax=Dibothriocephalus latus TaxID=60516 RepID=A0A3P7P2B4_DIBLA|nr:unnamed protein product [Dibothriocephalus latus]